MTAVQKSKIIVICDISGTKHFTRRDCTTHPDHYHLRILRLRTTTPTSEDPGRTQTALNCNEQTNNARKRSV